MKNSSLKSAYDYCQSLAQQHYENFPVASLMLPKKLRQPISVIYAFARTADDFADEGNMPAIKRLRLLDDYYQTIETLNTYSGDNPIFMALQHVCQTFSLPHQLFLNLLIAFKQDVEKNRYQTYQEVLDYCHHSANPVGRLLLHLQGSPSDLQLKQSDAICTALQLINFYQDILQDYHESDRIYISQQDLANANITEQDLTSSNNTTHVAPLLRQLYQRVVDLMTQGYPLGMSLTGRLGWEVRAMTLAGINTLYQLSQQPDTALLQRPRLSKWQLLTISLQALHHKSYSSAALKLLNNSVLH